LFKSANFVGYSECDYQLG